MKQNARDVGPEKRGKEHSVPAGGWNGSEKPTSVREDAAPGSKQVKERARGSNQKMEERGQWAGEEGKHMTLAEFGPKNPGAKKKVKKNGKQARQTGQKKKKRFGVQTIARIGGPKAPDAGLNESKQETGQVVGGRRKRKKLKKKKEGPMGKM